MNLQNFGEQFASKVIQKVYAEAVGVAICNRDYEGEINKPGDRVHILSFLNDILLSDYAVGTDMSSETIIDAQDNLVVEKRKYYNFALDRLENLFTYGTDIPGTLLENAKQVLTQAIDSYILEKATDAKVGSWVGIDLYVAGGAITMASLVTSATGGTVSLLMGSNLTGETAATGNTSVVENPRDGVGYSGGFSQSDVGKGFRLVSSAAFVSPWYRISGVTYSLEATVTEWDGAVSGSDFAEGDTLRGLFGGDGRDFPKYGSGDAKLVTMSGLGWEIQAAGPTAVSASSIYDQTTLLAEKLNANNVPGEDRHLTVPETIVTALKQAAETQPTGIADIYTGTVINGKFARMGGFDIHMATGVKLSTRVGHQTMVLGDSGPGGVVTNGPVGYFMLANTTRFITYADKWSESRVVDAENQFAKKYQGLFLYGAKVPAYCRKFGAVLFGNF
jgi:hypothetical protein